MKAILLITVTVTVAFVNGSNSRPCQPRKINNNYNPYTDFLDKHILRQDFDRSSGRAWRTYLRGQKLCNRPLQSFIEKEDQLGVEGICDGCGRQLDACDKIENRCVPVHYEKYSDQRPDNNAVICQA